MTIEDLAGKKIVIWGTGREGMAAAELIRARLPDIKLTFVDDAPGAYSLMGCQVLRGDITTALNNADVVVKSPGISLYDPRLAGKTVTSLMTLWFAGNTKAKTICISGTKGKSTTCTLLAHVMTICGLTTSLSGNIGHPLSAADWDADYVVVEVSSYQAANFDGLCDIGMVTNLYEEHLDWHGTPDRYFADKLNLLAHARSKLIGKQALEIAGEIAGNSDATVIPDAPLLPANPYLRRSHNVANIAAVLAVTQQLGLDDAAAVAAMEDFQGLAHRQYELGSKHGILYVDDSIATTPQATNAALDVYRDRSISLICGGFDRGIDYGPLILGILTRDVDLIVCLGDSGRRIHDMLCESGHEAVAMAENMAGALKIAREYTPRGGVILLSPAAPSYGMFKDFQERGRAFAAAAGFTPSPNCETIAAP